MVCSHVGSQPKACFDAITRAAICKMQQVAVVAVTDCDFARLCDEAHDTPTKHFPHPACKADGQSKGFSAQPDPERLLWTARN
jgi:hypothetical protein